jgi:hypothetical protein
MLLLALLLLALLLLVVLPDFFLNFFCYEVIVKQKIKKRSANNYLGVVVNEHRRKIPRWSQWGRSTFY